MSYEEEDACMSYEEDTCMSYEEQDTSMSYEEEDTCMSRVPERASFLSDPCAASEPRFLAFRYFPDEIKGELVRTLSR